MSTPVLSHDRAPRRRGSSTRIDRILFIAIPAIACTSLAVTLAVESTGRTLDLQLVHMPAGRAGESLAVRGLLLEEEGEMAVPKMLDAEASLVLIDGAGAIHGRAKLRRSAAGGMEGEVSLPATPGIYRLEASTAHVRGRATVRTKLKVVARGASLPDRTKLRIGSPLRQYKVLSLERDNEDQVLDVRVLGGVCVTSKVCQIATRVRDRSVRSMIEPSPTIEFLHAFATAPIYGQEIRVGQPEAVLKVRAFPSDRDPERDAAVATVQLPMMGVGLVVRADPVMTVLPVQPALRIDGLAPGRPAIIDAFLDGSWQHTATVAPEDIRDGVCRLPFVLSPGLWRLQVRSSALDTGSAGTAMVLLVDRAKGDVRAALAEVTQESVLKMDLRSGNLLDHELDHAARFIFALDELEVSELPGWVSGRNQGGDENRSLRHGMRLLSAILFFLGGLVVAVRIVQRGARASREAADVLRTEQSGETAPATSPMFVPVVAGIAVALAFASIAALVLARNLAF